MPADQSSVSQTKGIQQSPLETALREAPPDGRSEPPRQQSPRSTAMSLLDARSSLGLDRDYESPSSNEERDIDKKIALLRINPDISDMTKANFKLLFANYYLKPDRPNSPEIQERLYLNVRKTQPFSCDRRLLSDVQQAHLKKIIHNLLDRGIIRRSNSKFRSTCDVTEKNGTYRIHIDYRVLNSRIVSDDYPLPCVGKQLITVGNNKNYFSMINLEDAHYHVDIEEESRKYTSFMVLDEQYEFTKMPFDLKVAPAQFQRFMQSVMLDLVDTGDATVTMNGVLVATKTADEHLQILKHVFERFVRNKIAISFDKCEFLYNEIEYDNYLIFAGGVRPSTKILMPILDFPKPRDHKELDNFKKFIKEFELIAEPLRELRQKNRNFEFGERQCKAFQTLKVQLTCAPTLAIFTLGDETELHCEACPRAFGAVLLQRKDDHELHPILYFSQRTSLIEKKYGRDQLERCAIAYAVQRFEEYLSGIKFKIVTDNDSVLSVLNKETLDSKIDAGILEELETFDYVVEYRPTNRMNNFRQ